MKKIAVFTSGGDGPGMNAAIRAVVRTGIYHNLQVVGIMRGYDGLIDGDFVDLPAQAVGNIIQRGGTILKTARSSRFLTIEGRQQAIDHLKKHQIDGVVAIGGDGTFKGALELTNMYNIPIIGVPGTIDNDLYGTDYTIGYDTAINTVVEAVDKIRDTADSHHRLFIVEVMGRDAGFIALRSGIAVGAEAILIPESKTDLDHVMGILDKGWQRQKSSAIIIVAEGEEEGGAFEVARRISERFTHFETRVSILGHIQRGGSPTCMDRVMASQMGMVAVEALISGKKNIMIGVINNLPVEVPLEKAVKHHIDINETLLRMGQILSH